LKLENLLLDKHRNVIITDFGFANRFEHRKDDLMATSCGSPCYAAPELVVSDGLYVGSAVDIWSCGVILYAMLSGYLPFDDDPENPEGDNINLLYKYIINTPLTFPDWISPTARDLMQSMLVPNPEQRFTLAQVMNHPWLEPFRPLFSRSVEELEMIAQEQMQHKRQASRRDMQARMKAREAARINHLAQTAGVLPGQQQQPRQTAGMQDHQRRHKSDMPMGYGVASSPLVASQMRPTAASQESTATDQRNSVPQHVTPPIITSGLGSTPKQAVSTPTAPLSGGFSGSVPKESRMQSMERTRTEEDAKDDPVALEAEARASARIRADAGPRSESLQYPDADAKSQGVQDEAASISNPRSAPQGSNRHTIQVEYDGDAAYDRLLEIQAERRKALENEKRQGERMLVDAIVPSSGVSPVTLAPAVSAIQPGVNPSRAPMVSKSRSEGDSAEQMDVDITAAEPIPTTATAPHAESSEQPQPTAVPSSPVLAPSVIRLVPPTPVKDPLSANATPRPPQLEALQTVLPLFSENQAEKEGSSARSHLPVPTRLASTSTYSSSGSDPQTPRLDAASGRPYVKISTQSRQPSVSSTASLAADLAPSPSVSVGSNASGNNASVSGKKDRSRKGLSMNSFGFGKLLSGGNASTDSIPPAGGRGQGGKEAGTFLSRGGSTREKAKKRAEQKKEERPMPRAATAPLAPQT
jgi:protein-serine/threonine kinase